MQYWIITNNYIYVCLFIHLQHLTFSCECHLKTYQRSLSLSTEVRCRKGGKLFFSLSYMHHLYSNSDLNNIIKYGICKKIERANFRFNESIIAFEVLTVLQRTNFRCLYCEDVLKPSTWQLDHFNPKATGGKNVIENLVAACKWCNTMKNALDGYSFLKKCARIFKSNLHTEVPHPVLPSETITLQEHFNINHRKIKEANIT